MNISNHVDTRNPEKTEQRITEGNEKFQKGILDGTQKDLSERRIDTSDNGQFPIFCGVSSSKGEIDIHNILNFGHGEAFAVRNANVECNKEMLSSVLYAVEHLHVPYVGVFGDKEDLAKAKDSAEAIIEHPSVKPFIESGKLVVKVMDYDIESGAVTKYDINSTELSTKIAEYGECKVEYTPFERAVKNTNEIIKTLEMAASRAQKGETYLPSPEKVVEKRKEIAKFGPNKDVLFVGCSDSRMPVVSQYFGLDYGSYDSIAVAGAFYTDSMKSSVLEAVEHGAKVFVVGDHTKCGAVTAAATGHEEADLDGFLNPLNTFGIKNMEPDIAAIKVAATSAEKIAEIPEIKDLLANDELKICVTNYNIKSGATQFCSIKEAKAMVADFEKKNNNRLNINTIMKQNIHE